jgi:NAD(P)H-flavin reductase
MALAGTGTLALPEVDPLQPDLYRVVSVGRELVDTVTLEIVPITGPTPAAEPGQFNMLYAFGVGEIAISISGTPASGAGFLHTVRDVGAVSRAIAQCQVGDVLGLRGPFGVGWPVAAAEGSDVVFVAGGLGLAPLRPAIRHVLEHRARYGRVVILFGTRSPADLLFPDEIKAWRQRLDIEVEVTVDHADPDWHGHVGVVPGLIPHVMFDPTDTVALVCGPEVMMRFTASALLTAGVPADHVYLSMERNMKCAIGLCGHCQFGPDFVCKDGPVMRFDRIAEIFALREV